MEVVLAPPETTNRRVALLGAQAFSLGLMTAWIAIPASAIFLETYGSGMLPLTYIGAAAAGAATSAALGVAVRRRPLVSVTMGVLAILAVTVLASWLLLWLFDANWLSFGLLVLVPILVPVGFMLIVAQAGMLLDVRALKSLYGRVIAGFAFGFVVGGVLGPSLITLLGSTEHLLAGGAAAAGMFMCLVAVTRRNFSAELSVVDETSTDVARPTLRSLLRHRYVVLIVGFQMLSAVESQWLDFLVFDRAGKRYTDTDDLATFISRFVAIAYGADIIFLLLLAGVLMSRFGLRYGLTANPITVLALLATMIVTASLQGSGATAVFVLVVATRVSDLVLADGAARTSLSAAYQAVPTRVRLSAQAAVEGLAVPVAIGMSGVMLMVVRSTVGTDGLALPILTSVVVAVWAVVAYFVYRDYRISLLENLRHRSLDPSELTIESASTLTAIHRLVESTDERDVRLGLETLAAVDHDDLARCLYALASDDRFGVRSDVLDRLVDVDPAAARAAAQRGLHDPSPDLREASVRTLGSVGDASDLPSLAECLSDSSGDVQVASVTAMMRIGGEQIGRQVGLHVAALLRQESADGLVVAARILGVSDESQWIDRSLLTTLLGSPEQSVVNAALSAVRWPHDEGAFDIVIGHLDNRVTAAAAVDALARSGDVGLDIADHGLGGAYPIGQSGTEHFARVCREIGGNRAIEVLRRHLGHRDREVGLAVMAALAAVADAGSDVAAGRRDGTRSEEPEGGVLRADLGHASHVLRALATLQDFAAASVLRSALTDELELLRRRVLTVLSIRYGSDELSMVAHQLAQQSTRLHALAMEWLDVTLVGTDRASVALLEPDASVAERSAMLSRWFPLPATTAESVLIDIADDPDDRWRRPWITACAILAGAETPALGLEQLAEAGSGEPHGPSDITLETIEAIRRRRAMQII